MFHVNRLNWHQGATGFVRLPGEFRVATFSTAEAAHAQQQRLEESARQLVNPFAGGPAPMEQSNLPEPILCDRFRDQSIEPPAPDRKTGVRNWARWWVVASKKWSPEQRASAWEALDRMRFFEVIEEPEYPVVYAVAEAEEHYYEAHYVYLETAYRSRESAEKECSTRNSDVLNSDHGPEDDPKRRDPLAPFRWGSHVGFDFEDRPVGNWPNGKAFCLVVPIEVVGRPRNKLYVVARVVCRLRDNDCFAGPMEGGLESGHAYSFVRGFSSQNAAEEFRRAKVKQARECVAPGRIVAWYNPQELAGAIAKLGLVPPDPEELENELTMLMPWWASVAGTATPKQRAGVWDLLTNVPLYVVLETKLKD
jgi:hypothetical protein